MTFVFTQLIGQPLVDILVSDQMGPVVGLTFSDDGSMYAWSKKGKIFTIDHNQSTPELLLDISEEVVPDGDHGLLGFALDPNFMSNGYLYLLYAVDRHHLLYFGTSEYSPTKSIKNEATIGRITRYTADPNNEFKTILPNSRKILLGENKQSGIPLLHNSHGVGSLEFGTDRTLLVSTGDGATFTGADIGGTSAESYNFQALEDGIIRPKEDIGAFRAQLPDALNGKILRINPDTGEGIPGNPFYDPLDPNAPRSKVWALGLRNPYRIRVKPGTGSHNPNDANPGEIYIGDVGWAYWEELNIAFRPGMNFGWPLYEGMNLRYQYFGEEVYNQDTPNLLYSSTNGCQHPFLSFQDLLLPSTSQPNPFFPNPCALTVPIPEDIPVFIHQSPVITWSNSEWNLEEQGTHIPGFNSSGEGIFYKINDTLSPVVSDTFSGVCSVAGDFYTGTKFPSEYQNRFLGADMRGWIKSFRFDQNHQLAEISPLLEGKKGIIHLKMNPADECMYYIRYHPHFEIRKLCNGGNLPPVVEMEYSPKYGPGPLKVNFTGDRSFDPEGGKISYKWEFGDGVSSNQPNPIHEYSAPNQDPLSYSVTLTVTDSLGKTNMKEGIVSLNNTPPLVKITSVRNGDRYPVSGSTLLPLEANVSDIESDNADISYKWEVFYHHNTHVHPQPEDSNPISQFLLSPEGCNDEDFWYIIRLTVTDPHGLEAYDEVELFPYCDSPYVSISTFSAKAKAEMVSLNWTIDSYKSGLSFIVQRSKNLTSFNDLSTITPKEGQTSFSFDDLSPFLGDNFYRIMISGPSQWYDYSPFTRVLFAPKEPLTLFPNPFNTQINIYFKEIKENASLKVFDLYGNIIFNINFEPSVEEITHHLKVNNWATGIYIFKVKNGDDEKVEKLMKTN